MAEYAARQEIKAYFEEIKAAFASQNPENLAALFDPSITRPMTFPDIFLWARKFFGENQAVTFHLDKMDFQDLGPDRATVKVAYRVTTRGGKGDFSGTEIDILEKKAGWWRITSWEKLP